jgi:hypothetical protein
MVNCTEEINAFQFGGCCCEELWKKDADIGTATTA